MKTSETLMNSIAAGTLALTMALGVAAPATALAATADTTAQEQATTQAATKITADEAKAIALADAGYPEDQTCDMSIETFDNDETGVHKYWVSFCAPGMTQYDYHIDMYTGEILIRVVTC